jgi:hypothetical protein
MRVFYKCISCISILVSLLGSFVAFYPSVCSRSCCIILTCYLDLNDCMLLLYSISLLETIRRFKLDFQADQQCTFLEVLFNNHQELAS